MFFLLLALVWILVVLAIAIFVSGRVYQRTGNGVKRVLAFAACLVLLYVDAIPGYILFKLWGRTHPRSAVYETHQVEGFLYDNGSVLVAKPYLGLYGPYRFIEVHQTPGSKNIASESGRYVQLFIAESGDSRCIESLGHVRTADGRIVPDPTGTCIAATASDTPRSRYAFRELDAERRANSSLAFPILARRRQVIEIATGRVIADAWLAQYAPLLARTITMGPVITQGSSQGPVFQARDVLIPVR